MAFVKNIRYDVVEEAWRGATGFIRSALAPRFRILFESLQTVELWMVYAEGALERSGHQMLLREDYQTASCVRLASWGL